MKKIMIFCLMVVMAASAQVAFANLIVNGDFETGVIGPSTTEYVAGDLHDPGTYAVGTDPHAYHSAWTPYGDHTPTGPGYMLIVNAACDDGTPTPPGMDVVWEQTVGVTSDVDYVLSYWLANSYFDAPALIQLYINDVAIGVPATFTDVATWHEVSRTWNSGSDTSAKITLKDLTRAWGGDDFAIDDISFEAVSATIEKEMVDEGDLGDIITVTLTVDNPYGEAIKVEDVIPNGLKYIPGTFEVDGGSIVPTVDGSTISTTVGSGNHTIEFDVQVVEVQCEDVVVTNTANVYNPDTIVDDTDDVEITLYPYEGFSKDIVSSTESDPYNVPMYTDVHWLLLIEIENIPGDDITTMDEVVVKDNLGGDLEMHLCISGCPYTGKVLIQPPSQTPTVNKKGNTDKLQLSWALSDLSDDDLTRLYLEISTDINPGQGKKAVKKNEYTSDGPHDLNSGATLKFIDSEGTGFQLSAHTCPITVEAYEPTP